MDGTPRVKPYYTRRVWYGLRGRVLLSLVRARVLETRESYRRRRARGPGHPVLSDLKYPKYPKGLKRKPTLMCARGGGVDYRALRVSPYGCTESIPELRREYTVYTAIRYSTDSDTALKRRHARPGVATPVPGR